MSQRTPPFRRAQTPVSADSSGRSSLETGGAADPCPPAVAPPPFSLQPCRFRVGTWNVRGKSFRKDGKQNAKAPLIHSIMDVEKIDLLVVTETHSPDDLRFSMPNSAVLAQSGIDSSRAGVALVARDSFSWSCSTSTILVPGYALIAQVSHHKSSESFWVLCVYGNISGGHSSILAFYRSLLGPLSDFINDRPDPHWPGCLAAGDWNFVEHEHDRSSARVPNRALLACFRHIKALCCMSDSAGPGPLPRGFSHHLVCVKFRISSHLDRIYIPRPHFH